MDGEDLGPFLLAGQIDKKNFVKTTLAQQFWRQNLNVVGGGHDKHGRLFFGHPSQQATKHAAGGAAILVAAKGFINFVNPENAGSHGFGQLNELPCPRFRFADQPRKQPPYIQTQQRQLPMMGDRFGAEGFARTLNADQQ